MSEAPAPIEYQPKSSYGIEADFLIPVRWTFDGDLKRRAPVLDVVNANRVARLVGYRKCLLCKKPFWSVDIKNVHICDGFHSQLD